MFLSKRFIHALLFPLIIKRISIILFLPNYIKHVHCKKRDRQIAKIPKIHTFLVRGERIENRSRKKKANFKILPTLWLSVITSAPLIMLYLSNYIQDLNGNKNSK